MLALDEVEPPEPGPGQVRIAVEAAGLGLPDVMMCRNVYAFEPPLPATLGQEVVGRVTAVGPGCETPVGARVMAVTTFFLGHGGLADEALALDASSHAAPDDLPAEQAAGFVIPYHTAWIGLVTRGRLQAGETLLVLGAAGGSGGTALQLGKALGARVVAVAGGAEKARACRELGADHVIDHRAEPLAEALATAAGEHGFDVVYDPVGGDACKAALPHLASEGRLLAIGYASGAWHDASTRLLVARNASLLGVYVGAYAKPALTRVHEALLDHHRRGDIRVPVERVVPFAETARALQALADREVSGKLVVRVSDGGRVSDEG